MPWPQVEMTCRLKAQTGIRLAPLSNPPHAKYFTYYVLSFTFWHNPFFPILMQEKPTSVKAVLYCQVMLRLWAARFFPHVKKYESFSRIFSAKNILGPLVGYL